MLVLWCVLNYVIKCFFNALMERLWSSKAKFNNYYSIKLHSIMQLQFYFVLLWIYSPQKFSSELIIFGKQVQTPVAGGI